ncbi:MAG: hypothetical protein JSW64_10285 [Candidatus Zixiibacteriota bacterium]|nr:MAG: hypothetical protein JSW64_10285 [candidate division Zixibacteria bacterium]
MSWYSKNGRKTMPARFNCGMAIVFTILLFIFSVNCEDDGTNYENLSPNRPSNPTPPDGAADQPIDVQFFWSCSDPDGDPLVYDIFFGETGNPPPVASSHSDTTYNPGQLEYNTTYYWKIVAFDPRISRTGPIWSFTTEVE